MGYFSIFKSSIQEFVQDDPPKFIIKIILETAYHPVILLTEDKKEFKEWCSALKECSIKQPCLPAPSPPPNLNGEEWIKSEENLHSKHSFFPASSRAADATLERLKKKLNEELEHFLDTLTSTLLRSKLLTSSSPSHLDPNNAMTLHILQKLKEISIEILNYSIEDLKKGDTCTNIIKKINQLTESGTFNEYVARLLFIFAPTSRFVEFLTSQRTLEETSRIRSRKAKSLPDLKKFGFTRFPLKK